MEDRLSYTSDSEDDASAQTDTSDESPPEEDYVDVDESIYNDLIHLALIVKNIPKDELPQRMETIKAIAKGELVLKEYIEHDNSATQLFAFIMTLMVILMAVIIAILIETKMDFFNLQKFM